MKCLNVVFYYMLSLLPGGPEDKMQMLFKMFDMDKSGTLDKEEVTALVKSVNTSRPSILDTSLLIMIMSGLI